MDIQVFQDDVERMVSVDYPDCEDSPEAEENKVKRETLDMLDSLETRVNAETSAVSVCQELKAWWVIQASKVYQESLSSDHQRREIVAIQDSLARKECLAYKESRDELDIPARKESLVFEENLGLQEEMVWMD
uniref:(northern house mosquito) hypothetical protein n=1 Tax=Culex pipiens TaxID=7175 RepID=A0A8D8D2U9_CULPI